MLQWFHIIPKIKILKTFNYSLKKIKMSSQVTCWEIKSSPKIDDCEIFSFYLFVAFFGVKSMRIFFFKKNYFRGYLYERKIIRFFRHWLMKISTRMFTNSYWSNFKMQYSLKTLFIICFKNNAPQILNQIKFLEISFFKTKLKLNLFAQNQFFKSKPKCQKISLTGLTGL